MAFNADDEGAFNLGRQRDFQIDAIDTPERQVSLLRVGLFTGHIVGDEAAILTRVIQAGERCFNHGSSTTVWVDVATPDIPTFLQPALDGCNGFGVGLIITHAGASTHAPGPLLDAPLVESAYRANRGGTLWHPIAGCLVSTGQ